MASSDGAGAAAPAPVALVGALDQGTTSTRFILFDAATGSPVASHQVTHDQHYPHPGWVEHDPLEILKCAEACINGAVAEGGVDVATVKAIGITNQRETTVVWDKCVWWWEARVVVGRGGGGAHPGSFLDFGRVAATRIALFVSLESGALGEMGAFAPYRDQQWPGVCFLIFGV